MLIMIKKELRKMPKLKATPYMLRRAKDDKPKFESNRYCYCDKYNFWLYMRCCTKKGILKASFFLTEAMRYGGTKPIYDVYFDKKNKKYITYSYEKEKWLTASIYNLDWPSYWFASEKVYVCRETNKTLRKYFNTDKKGVEILINYQEAIMKEKLDNKYKKETDAWDDDLKQTPKLPKNFEEWLNKESIPEHFIFYNYSNKKLKEGFCTYCENNVLVENPLHKTKGVCPCCHKKIEYKALGRVGHFSTDYFPSYIIQRCKDGIMIRRFWARRIYYRGAPFAPQLVFDEGRRIICDKTGKPLRAYFYGDYKRRGMRWISNNIHTIGSYYSRDGRIYENSLKNLSKKELKGTALLEWYKLKNGCLDAEIYLSLLKEHPYIEKFIKAGLIKLASEVLDHSYYSIKYDVKADESSLIKLLCLDASKFKEFKDSDGGSEYLQWLQYEKKCGKTISIDIKNWFIKNNILPCNLNFITDKMNAIQIYNYLNKQMCATAMNCKEVLEMWKDYLEMAIKLNIDTSDEIIYRATKLRQRHAELIKKLQEKGLNERAKEILKSYPKIPAVLASIKSKYEYVGKEYSVIVPKGIEDILLEGRNLNHCVAEQDRYLDRIERQEAYIFFLRKNEEPDVSYYTLEVEPGGTIRQKRSKYDRQYADIDDAKKFLKEWQKIIKKRLNKYDKRLAEKSKILRLEEFAELDENNILIHGGELQGIRLVDVLMKDLMEAA